MELDPDFVRFNSTIVLTKLQKDVLVGTLLGDASAERRVATHNTRIRYDQSYPAFLKSASYLYYIYEILKSLTFSAPRIKFSW